MSGSDWITPQGRVTLIRTAPTSPKEYQRKLLRGHCSDESTGSSPHHGIAMNVAQLLNSLLLGPNIEVTLIATGRGPGLPAPMPRKNSEDGDQEQTGLSPFLRLSSADHS
jgi:hypothetical protein